MTANLWTDLPLFAQAPARRNAADVLLEPENVLTVMSLAGALLLLAGIIAWVVRWRKRQMAPLTETYDALSEFRAAYERGELSEEEYERVRRKLAGRLTAEPAKPSLPAAPPEATPPPAG
jgi:hypothetical protein